ncbi:flagellar hook-length control protein FliK [Sphingosinicella terrae]|uniref:flagellar hook-length control protein FliK n=1 Tax=Sphingosinicella terrae TaxID=2172047 RepID=UPI000E0DB5ED|nr:flagellar hook-length control protein FliK [Sphingosinicella terrae]
MASVPNMRLIPIMSPGPGDGSGEAGAAAGFARLLSTLPSEAGEATILPVQGDAAEPERGADEAESLSPADAILSLVGLAVPAPPASPSTVAPPAAGGASTSAPASAGPIGETPGSDVAELHPQDLAGIVKATAPAAAPAAPAAAPDGTAPSAEEAPGTMPVPAAPPTETARAGPGDRPILAAQGTGSALSRIGIDPQAVPLRPGHAGSPVTDTRGETPADFQPRPDVVVGVLRPELASGPAGRLAGRRAAEASDAPPPSTAVDAKTPAGPAIADPVETPGPGRIHATTSSVFIPATVAEPASPLSPTAPAPAADLPAPGEAAIERQLDVAADGEWLDQLARDIAGSGSDGKLRFRLNPETLGRLQVELTQTEQGASIRLTTESEAARALIADAQPRLMAEARAHGVRIAETHVDLSGGQTGDPRRHDPERRDPAIRTAGRDSHPAETADPRKPSGDRYA